MVARDRLWHRLRLVTLVTLVGCAGADAMPAPKAPAAAGSITQELGVQPGETMSFEVRIGGMLVGDAQVAVGELTMIDGHRRVKIHSRAATAGAVAVVKHVVDEATTDLDLDTGKPVSFETLVENGDKKTTATGKFTKDHAEITYVRDEDGRIPRTSTVPFHNGEVHDAHSSMVALRGWHAPPGSTRSVYVLGGKRLWRVDTTIGGSETIGTEMGNRSVVKLTGKAYRVRGNLMVDASAPTRDFTIYLSDDADRVPLRVVAQTELGDVVMTLSEYGIGATPQTPITE